MQCLLVAATVTEITPFLTYYRDKVTEWPENISVDILISGIGLTASAYSLTRQLHLKRPDLVIQAGIAGCFDKKMMLGSVVAVRRECIADEGVIESNQLKSLFDLQLLSKNKFPHSNEWLINKNDVLKKIGLKKVNAVSVNNITTSKKMIQFYQDKYNPVVESMEGAALHYVCLMEKVPFLQLRSISNYVGERNKKNWKIKESIINLNQELIRLLQKL